MAVGIDKGLAISYNANYPVQGVNQSSQQFRDNFSIIKSSIENLQTKALLVLGPLTGQSAQLDSGSSNVVLNLGFANGVVQVPSGNPALPGDGNLRFNSNTGQLEYFANFEWHSVATGTSAVETTGGVMTGPLQLYADPQQPMEAATKNYVDTHVSGFLIQSQDTNLGNAKTLNFSGGGVTTTLIGTTATISVAASVDASQVTPAVAAMFTGNQQNGITSTFNSSTQKVDLAAQNFNITLSGAVTGTATVNALGNVTIPTSISASASQLTVRKNNVKVGQRPAINIQSTSQIFVEVIDDPVNSAVTLAIHSLTDGWWRGSLLDSGTITDRYGNSINMGSFVGIIEAHVDLGTLY